MVPVNSFYFLLFPILDLFRLLTTFEPVQRMSVSFISWNSQLKTHILRGMYALKHIYPIIHHHKSNFVCFCVCVDNMIVIHLCWVYVDGAQAQRNEAGELEPMFNDAANPTMAMISYLSSSVAPEVAAAAAKAALGGLGGAEGDWKRMIGLWCVWRLFILLRRTGPPKSPGEQQ